MKHSGSSIISDGSITEAKLADDSVNMRVIDDGIKDAANGIPVLDSNGHLVGPIVLRKDTAANLDAVVLSAGELAQATDTKAIRAGDGASNGGYALGCDDATIHVMRGSTDVISGTNLLAAYTAAKSLTPGGNALSATNRATVKVPAGVYDLGTQELVLDTDFIDVIGVGICRCLDFDNGIISYPDSVITSETTTPVGTQKRGVVVVDTRDYRLSGFRINQENTNPSFVTSNGCLAFLDTDNADRGVCEDLGFTYDHTSGFTVLCYDANQPTLTNGSYFRQCHATAAILDGNFSGDADYCTGGNGSFCGSNDQILSGTCRFCKGGDSSFGDAELSGTVEDCVAGDDSFAKKISGTVRRCSAGNGSFGFGTGMADNEGLTVDALVEDCIGGTGCLYGAYTLGTVRRCHFTSGIVGLYSFEAIVEDSTLSAVITGVGSFSSVMNNTATLRRCAGIGFADAIKKFKGLMDGCSFEITGTDKNAVEVESTARIYNSTLIANGTGKSIYASAAQDAKIAHCRLNKGIDANVTNLIGTPYNVDDTDVSL